MYSPSEYLEFIPDTNNIFVEFAIGDCAVDVVVVVLDKETMESKRQTLHRLFGKTLKSFEV
jgi:hypothetical protein